MAKLLQIAQLGQPVIRRRAAGVTNPVAKTTQELIDDLIATVKETDGVGIAAPQVYQSKRLFILASHPNPRYPKAPRMKPTVVINPKIIAHSQQTKKDWEGCLSIPGIRALVPRWQTVETKFTTRQGKTVKRHFSGFVARIFQHELDHLNGIVFLDRVDSSRDIITEKEYQRIVR